MSKKICRKGHAYEDNKSVGRKGFCPICKKANAHLWYATNKIKKNEANKSWVRENPIRSKLLNKSSYIRRKYGLTLEQFETMLQQQNNKCLICGEPESIDRALAIDHCHHTGKVRGLLCNRCNHTIGLVEDSIEILQSAITYLSVSKETV